MSDDVFNTPAIQNSNPGTATDIQYSAPKSPGYMFFVSGKEFPRKREEVLYWLHDLGRSFCSLYGNPLQKA